MGILQGESFDNTLRWLRTWSGIGLIFLVSVQIVTGYALVGRLELGPVDYQTIRAIHTQFSWILIYFFLTHAVVTLRYLFHRWWPHLATLLVRILILAYIASIIATLYVQFLR